MLNKYFSVHWVILFRPMGSIFNSPLRHLAFYAVFSCSEHLANVRLFLASAALPIQ